MTMKTKLFKLLCACLAMAVIVSIGAIAASAGSTTQRIDAYDFSRNPNRTAFSGTLTLYYGFSTSGLLQTYSYTKDTARDHTAGVYNLSSGAKYGHGDKGKNSTRVTILQPMGIHSLHTGVS